MRIKEILKCFNKKSKKFTVKDENKQMDCVHDPVAVGSTLVMSRKTCMVYPPEYVFVCTVCENQFTYYKKNDGSFTKNIKETSAYSH